MGGDLVKGWYDIFTFTSAMELGTNHPGLSQPCLSWYTHPLSKRTWKNKYRVLKVHVHPSSFACPVLQKMISFSLKLLSSVCVESCFGQVWKEWTLYPIKTLNLTKKAFQNKNTSTQSHLVQLQQDHKNTKKELEMWPISSQLALTLGQ